MFVDTYHSRMGFAPGMLSVCDQSVQYIEWDTTDRQSAMDVWEMLAALQASSAPLHQSHQAFYDRFKGVKNLMVARLVIRTDVNTIELHPHSKQHILVKLPDEQTFECRATPRFEAAVSETAQVLDIALHLASCTTLQSAQNKLSKMAMLGIAAKWEP